MQRRTKAGSEYFGQENHSFPGTRYLRRSSNQLYLVACGILDTSLLLQEPRREKSFPRGADSTFVTEECGRDERATMVVKGANIEAEWEDPFTTAVEESDAGQSTSLLVAGMYKFVTSRTK